MAFASGIAAGVAPLGQRERGGSRNTPLTLWPSGATPAAMHLAKGIRPAPRDHPRCGKRRFRMPSALLWAYLAEIKFLYWQFRLIASVPPRGKADPLCLPFFSAFFRDFPLLFRWKAVVDSVQFRVILNITTKRFALKLKCLLQRARPLRHAYGGATSPKGRGLGSAAKLLVTPEALPLGELTNPQGFV